MQGSIEDSWNRIRRWMTDHSPNMLLLLRQPTQPDEIHNLEVAMQLEDNAIPEDFRLAYTTGHNGSSARSFFGSSTISFSFYKMEDILEDWTNLKSTHGPENDEAHLQVQRAEADHMHPEIKNLMWSERWIPFGGYEGNCICIDLDPVDTINRGQVIHWFHNGDSPILVAPSFAVYLQRFADDMEDGRYSLSQDGRKLIYTEPDNDP